MAGSFDHIDENGAFRMDLIENMGDAHEALQECHAAMYVLAKGNRKLIIKAIRKLYKRKGGINKSAWPIELTPDAQEADE
jgi:hypothetical protein